MGLGFCSEIPWKSIIDITWIWVFVAYVLGLPWSSQISDLKGGNPQKLRPRVATRAFQVVWDHLSGKGSKAWTVFGACDPYPLMRRPKLSWDVPTQLMWGTQNGTGELQKSLAAGSGKREIWLHARLVLGYHELGAKPQVEGGHV